MTHTKELVKHTKEAYMEYANGLKKDEEVCWISANSIMEWDDYEEATDYNLTREEMEDRLYELMRRDITTEFGCSWSKTYG